MNLKELGNYLLIQPTFTCLINLQESDRLNTSFWVCRTRAGLSSAQVTYGIAAGLQTTYLHGKSHDGKEKGGAASWLQGKFCTSSGAWAVTYGRQFIAQKLPTAWWDSSPCVYLAQVTFILGKYWELCQLEELSCSQQQSDPAVSLLGAVLPHPCCKGSTPLKRHSKSYKATKGNMWLAISPIMIQLCFPHTPHCPLLKQVTSSPQRQPCLQQQCCRIPAFWQALHLQQ